MRPATIVNQGFFRMNAESEEEALFLCGVINAGCMQQAWQAAKPAKLHYDKDPLRCVGILEFAAVDRAHGSVVRAAAAMEAAPTADHRRRLDAAVA